MPAVFAPTQAEAALVNQVFLQADPQRLGVITTDAGVKIFDGSGLPSSKLAEIWNLADKEDHGWLSRKGVAIALRLMGWAQKGEVISEALIQRPGPLPQLEGINSIGQQNTGISLPRSPLPHFPPLTPQDREKFHNIFLGSGPVNGLLSGEKARDIFLKSRLPNEQLSRIWNLADTQDRGNLDSSDFAIGMYFIQCLMANKITFIPTSLPPGLAQQAGSGVASHATGTSASFSPSTGSGFNIQPQYTGPVQRMQPNHTGASNTYSQAQGPALPPRPIPSTASRSFSPPIQAPTPVPWDVTDSDKVLFDTWFDDLDQQKNGYVDGGVVGPFMIQSGLPGDVLAKIWDLADVSNNGQLSREAFAVAMHLIQKKMAGKEVPDELPPSLVPPSLRPPPSMEQPKDLFSFDDSPPPSAVQPQMTGGFAAVQHQRTGTMSPQQTGGRVVSMAHDPFSAPSVTSSYNGPQSRSPRNFLDDDDHEPSPQAASPPLRDQSAEIGNAKNQLASTNTMLEKTRSERESLEQALASQAALLSALQSQLSSAKAAYDTELKLLATLKERHTTQQAEIEKARQELITGESDLSAIRVEKSEIGGAFMRDKEDHRELNRKMVEVGQQTEAIKVEIEKLKKDAKQQKGLLAIAKKQLASKEAERAKAETEMQEANEELEESIRETEETEAALAKIEMPVPVSAKAAPPPPPVRATSADSVMFAASQPLPVTPDPATSPVSVKSNNPFERLTMGGSNSRNASPFAPFGNSSLPKSPEDDFFSGFNKPDTVQSDDGHFSNEGLAYDKPNSPELNNGLALPNSPLQPVSPNETELFHTPPTSARVLSPEPQGSLDAMASKFPAIESVTAQIDDKVPTKPEPSAGNDDFDSLFGGQGKIQDLDVDESDSDSDDEVPLAVLAGDKPKEKEKEKEAAQPPPPVGIFDDVFASSTGPKPSPNETNAAPASNAEIFDNIFEPTTPVAAGADVKTTGTSAAAPDTDIFSPGPDAKQPSAAGIDAFDEALGKIAPNTTDTTIPAFSFDSAFDDNFDFNAVKSDSPSAVAPPPPQPTGPTGFDDAFGMSVGKPGGSVAVPPQQVQAGTSFDDAFGTPVAQAVAPSQQAEPQPVLADAFGIPSPRPVIASPPPPQQSELGPAFDDAFQVSPAKPFVNGHPTESAGVPAPISVQPQAIEATKAEVKPATSFDEAFAPSSPPASNSSLGQVASSLSTSRSPPAAGNTSTNPFPVNTPVISPKGSFGKRSTSPLAMRTSSPPPRVVSPKPRPSTSSSKDGHEKPQAPPPRHSKLSIRLPFGRKKKDKQHHEPMPSSHLAPHRESPERARTPATDEDVEAVKQLTAMGFSRGQAVEALEKYGYDVPRALNSLLGQQS